MASEEWRSAYRNLVQAVVNSGYPEELGVMIARHLGSENTMRRMTMYLYSARPGSAEEIVDEMLAIASDRDKWKDKALTEEANQAYNEFLRMDLESDDD